MQFVIDVFPVNIHFFCRHDLLFAVVFAMQYNLLLTGLAEPLQYRDEADG